MSARKIADKAVQNRTQSPFWIWIKRKLLAVDRQSVTPPPGIAGPDGKAQFSNPCRFPNSQSARPGSAELPLIPGGIHHKIEANYYFTRDGRREVNPPQALYAANSQGVHFGTHTGEAIQKADAVKVNIGPESNFGLQAPTPGFGAVWTRSRDTELQTQQEDPSLAHIERFDKYARSN